MSMEKPVYPKKNTHLGKKLSSSDIEEIKELFSRSISRSEIARRFNVNYTTVLYHTSSERKQTVNEYNTSHRKVPEVKKRMATLNIEARKKRYREDEEYRLYRLNYRKYELQKKREQKSN